MAENFYTELKIGGTISEALAITILDILNNNFDEGTLELKDAVAAKQFSAAGEMSFNEFEELENHLRKLNVTFTFTMYPRDDYPGILLYNFPDLNMSGQTSSDSNGHPIIRISNVIPLINIMKDFIKGVDTLAIHINDEPIKDMVAEMLRDPHNLIPILEKNIKELLPEIPDTLPDLSITSKEILNMKKYYHVHVNDNDEGYSVWFESTDTLLNQEQIVNKAIELDKIDADDAPYVDTAEETTQQDYLDATK